MTTPVRILLIVVVLAMMAGSVLAVEAGRDPQVARGTQLLRRGHVVEAVKLLERAVAQQPQSAAAHGALAQAYAHGGRASSAWQHARQAVELAPKDAAVGNALNLCWHALGRQGLINVGRTDEQVRDKLGDPDLTVNLGAGRQRWYYRWWGLDFVNGRLFEWVGGEALGETGPSFWPSVSSMKIGNQRFVAGHRGRAADHGVTQFVPAGQSIQQHDAMIVVQRFIGGAQRLSLDARVRQILEAARRADPDLRHRIIMSSTNDLLYEWRIDGGPRVEPQHEIARFMRDGADVLRLAYVRKTPRMPESDVRFWLKLIRSDLIEQLAGAN